MEDEVPQSSACVECQNSSQALDSFLVFHPSLSADPHPVLCWSDLVADSALSRRLDWVTSLVPFNPSCFMMMLLKASPVENICACVAEDHDAQEWASIG